MAEQTVNSLLALSDDDLLELFEVELFGSWSGMSSFDRNRRRKAALRWVSDWIKEHRELICKDKRVRAAVINDWSVAEDAAMLMDVLAEHTNLPNVATLAVILARRGIRSLCADA